MKLISTNPAKDYEYIGQIEVSSEQEIKDKVSKAHNAKDKWNNIGLSERINLMQKVYDSLYLRRQELSKIATLEMGFPKSQQELFDLGDGFNYFNWYLKNAEDILKTEITFESDSEIHRVFYEPSGVVAVIQPWNFPFCQWSWNIVPNLIAGNTVVFKHSEECPLTGKLIEDIVNTILPDGVFNEIYGGKVEGEILIEQDITLISFTGSTTTGKKIYAKAGERFLKAVMEMGGSAPGIIYKDADLENTIESVFNLRFTNNGQCCDGLKRLIVHEDIYSDVLNSLKNLINKNKIGDPLDKDTFFGPLSAKRQQELLISQVDDAVKKGAIVEIGGKVPNNLKGAYYEPTILTKISKDMKVWQEEVFGPVLPIITFKTDEEAIEPANDTPYGLGGYIFTKDKQKALKVASHLKTGMISINGVNYVNPWNPFGGYKNSGMGREHGHWGLKELTQVKIVVLNKD